MHLLKASFASAILLIVVNIFDLLLIKFNILLYFLFLQTPLPENENTVAKERKMRLSLLAVTEVGVCKLFQQGLVDGNRTRTKDDKPFSKKKIMMLIWKGKLSAKLIVVSYLVFLSPSTTPVFFKNQLSISFHNYKQRPK